MEGILLAIRRNLKLFSYMGKLLSGETSGLSLTPIQYVKPTWQATKASVPLLRSTPEEQGISSQHIAKLYQKAGENKEINPHSMIVLRHGVVVAEAGYSPYTTDVWHVTHSLCKSITAMAVGLAIEEELFSLDDLLADHFPEYCGMFTGRKTRTITIKHLLTMTSGVAFKEMDTLVDTHWAQDFFDADVASDPGSTFDYNSLNSYMLSCLLQKTTGQTLVEYLTSRLFEPLQMGSLAWEKSPEGIQKGGWGMYLLPEDMAKFGQLCLQKGAWEVDGVVKQLLSKEWVEEMTSTAISKTSKEGQGYGYHLWTDLERNAYYFSGLFGQRVYVDPTTDSVIVMTAGNSSMLMAEESTRLFHWYLEGIEESSAPISSEAVDSSPEHKDSSLELTNYLDSLSFMTPSPDFPLATPEPEVIPEKTWREKVAGFFKKEEPLISAPLVDPFPSEGYKILGQTYIFEKNRAGLLPFIPQAFDGNYTVGISSISFSKKGEELLRLLWKEGSHENVLDLSFDGKSPVSQISIGYESFEISANGTFAYDEDSHLVLKIRLCFLEESSTREIKLFFMEDHQLLVTMKEVPEIVYDLESAMGKATFLSLLPTANRNKDYNNFLIEQLGWPKATGKLDSVAVPEASK